MIIAAIADLVKSALYACIEKKGKDISGNNEYKKFVEDIENWYSSFVEKNDSTVLASTDFYNYITNC